MRGSLAASLLALALLPALPACTGDGRRTDEKVARFSPIELMGEESDPGFRRALEPREFTFPADHGPHPGFRVEWWYFVGNLRSEEGRRFGYQLTFFRNALTPEPQARESAWAASEVYMAHLALTDVGDGRFHAFERFSRAALDLAGARSRPFRVWLGDWRAIAGEGGGPHTFHLQAAAEEEAIDLRLVGGKPPVLQGDRGLSPKGSRPGNASYYYSLTRMPTHGRVRIAGRDFQVEGSSWLDREWSTSALEPDQAGWDWFALQLDDGRELMVYRLRRSDGSPHPASAGSLVEADGTSSTLGVDDLEIEVLATWRSPETGALYPAAWRISLPGEEVELTVQPLLADQEHRGTFVYWEGAVEARGLAGGRQVTGLGYVELTGYDIGSSR